MITVLKTENEFIDFHHSNHKSIGFAPTMGNLHEGHITLLRQALKENDIGIISIFVNPTQFAVGEDLDDYPRTWEEDLAKIEALSKEFPKKDIIIFFPESEKVIYPDHMETTFSHPELRGILEGKFRPTHFDGVTTVVKRLFEIVKPDKSYFGKKDYQQLAIINDMTQKLQLPVEIIGMPIIREASGLAMSSRNLYLDVKQREQALTLNKTLNHLANVAKNDLLHAQKEIPQILAQDSHWNYLEIRQALTLKEASSNDKELVILGNYQLGQTRLLDNIEVSL
jgi:pantoate--beta-alanine ligase